MIVYYILQILLAPRFILHYTMREHFSRIF